MTQFNRSASALVQTAAGSEAVNITGLRIAFDINKTESKDPNTAKISIYNLSEATRNRIKMDEDPKTDQLILLNAGYLDGDGEELIFAGTITSIAHTIKKPEVVTVIDAHDGKGSLDKTKLAISHASNSSGKSILNSILRSFPLPNNLTTIKFTDKIYKNGYAFTGLSKTAMDKVTDYLDLDWSIQNNEIKVSLFDGDDRTRAVLLSPSTGLIGSPERLSGEARKAKKKTKKIKPGWKLEATLSPKILPKGQVGVSSKEIPNNSIFTVKSVSHSGDTHGSQWNSNIEVHEP